MIQQSYVEATKAATTYSGPDAVEFLRVKVLQGSIGLYRKTKIIPTRGVTITMMLAMATQITGTVYKGKTKCEAAEADLQTWIDTMRAALPISINGEQQ